MRPRLIIVAALMATASPALAGCGGEQNDETSTASATEQDGESKRVVIEAADGAFDAQAIYENAAAGRRTCSVAAARARAPGS